MLLTSLLIGGVLAYTGSELLQSFRGRHKRSSSEDHANVTTASAEPAQLADPLVESANDNFKIASASLGLVLVGAALPAALYVGMAGLVYLVAQIWKRARHDLTKRKRFTRMVLEAIVLPATLLTGAIVASATAFWFLYLALDQVARAKGRTNQLLEDVFSPAPEQKVWAIYNGTEVQIPLQSVQKGDILVLEAGEVVPIDGRILEGDASVDERMLTGESLRSDKQAGDQVLASSLLLTGRISILVDKTGDETISAQIGRTLDGMTSYTQDLELRSIELADRWALPYLGLGGLAMLLRGVRGGLAVMWFPLDDALYSFGPLSVVNHLNMALDRGILIKDGRALELLPRVDTVVFDKTGTLTRDLPEVAAIHTCADVGEARILGLAAAAEHKHSHPIARAIRAEAEARGIRPPTIHDPSYEVGYGIKVTVDGERVLVGSDRFMAVQSLPIPEPLRSLHDEARQPGYSAVYVAIDDRIVGAIELRVGVRKEAAALITTLEAFGLTTIILSGDSHAPTQKLASELGVDEYVAGALPADKARRIAELQARGRTVCYVGDGINDALALKQAEVSISFSGASTIATDTAQIVLTSDRIDQLIDVFELSRELDESFRQVVVAGLVPSVAIATGVFIFGISLTSAMLMYTGGMAFGVYGAMRPRIAELVARNKTNAETDPAPEH
ncbi:MAG: heavy metal translocating P-type ATPase [Myxococcota bacterium]